MPARKPNSKELEIFRGLLLRSRSILSGDIHQLEVEALGSNPAVVEGEIREEYRDVAGQEFSLDLMERDERTLREVDEALERIESGEFGRCQSCQTWIPKDRLRAMPHTTHCVDCQRRAEGDR